MNFIVALEQYRGTSYHIGYRQGQEIEDTLIKRYANMAEGALTKPQISELALLFTPNLLDELKGLAMALNMSLARAAKLFSGYGVTEIEGMGCSSVVNDKMFVRNYDFSPKAYDARLVLAQPDAGYASIGHSLHVLGRTEGVNEKGLAIALHFVNNQDIQMGLTAGMVVRIVLDTCKYTQEAINLIQQLPHSWCNNFSIGDAKGHTAVVEASPFRTSVRDRESISLCTNHFQRPDMAGFNRNNIENTENRINYLCQNRLEDMNGRDVFNLFRDIDTPLYNENYAAYFATLHTFAYLFEHNTIVTAVPGGEVLSIDFSEWVKGRDIEQKELSGHLNV